MWVGGMCHKSWCRVVVPAYFRDAANVGCAAASCREQREVRLCAKTAPLLHHSHCFAVSLTYFLLSIVCISLSCTRAHTSAHIHTHTDAYMQTRTCIHKHTYTRTHTHAYTHAPHIQAHTRIRTHVQTYAHIHTLTHAHTHTHTHTHAHTQTHSERWSEYVNVVAVEACNTRTHSHSHEHAHTHTHIHTHSKRWAECQR